jgi:hypothetical protein
MNLRRKDFKNCVICKGSFNKLHYAGKGKCRSCYGKEYFGRTAKKYPQKTLFYYEHLAKEHLRKKNRDRLNKFINYVSINKEYINHIDAFIMADLFDIYYPHPHNKKLDILSVEDQLIYMWNYIKKL